VVGVSLDQPRTRHSQAHAHPGTSPAPDTLRRTPLTSILDPLARGEDEQSRQRLLQPPSTGPPTPPSLPPNADRSKRPRPLIEGLTRSDPPAHAQIDPPAHA
jgi:hypothetical protein